MTFDRTRLPDPAAYFEGVGLLLHGPRNASWKTTECRFHGGSDSMRVCVHNGAFKCMNCGVSGGDVVDFHMQSHGLDFIQAIKALGAWVEDGGSVPQRKHTTLSARDALQVIAFESTLTAVAAGNLAQGMNLSDGDRARLLVCAQRISKIIEEFT